MTTRVDGVDYSPEGIESVRQGLVELRDSHLGASPDFHAAVLLSHAVAYLHEYAQVAQSIEAAFESIEGRAGGLEGPKA